MAENTRRTSLEVLHLSMPRTGSLSMMAAYEILGWTTLHGIDYASNSADQIKWEEAIDAKFYGKGRRYGKADFDREDFLGRYNVLSDFPAVAFREELLEFYPEAKVVLVERDVEKWYASFKPAVIDTLYTWKAWIMVYILEPYFLKARPATAMMKLEYHMFKCHDQESFAANARDTFRERNEWVKKNVPKERLLVYELGSGWEPLCKFLGKEVPDEPFPWKNEGKEFAIWMRKTQTRILVNGVITAAKILAVPGTALLLGWIAVKSGLLA